MTTSDDGLKAGYIGLEELNNISIWRRTADQVRKKFPALDEERQIYQTISHLIGHLIQDLVATTRARLTGLKIDSLTAVRHQGHRLVGFSDEVAGDNRELKSFLYRRLYRHYKVERMRVKAERILTLLFETYVEHPTLLPENDQRKFDQFGVERVICDYLAGMIDRYTLDEYKRLFEPYERV
jgi:dGTPase